MHPRSISAIRMQTTARGNMILPLLIVGLMGVIAPITLAVTLAPDGGYAGNNTAEVNEFLKEHRKVAAQENKIAEQEAIITELKSVAVE